jgi:hypothetical protein
VGELEEAAPEGGDGGVGGDGSHVGLLFGSSSFLQSVWYMAGIGFGVMRQGMF